ncbi:hypothetical protein DPM18_08105 [Polynucleobacter paneuropaeus]|uniref:hypothetical protein n=1 Tax=Polynucleobacter paneuropaeus TaxID=2527775 RepID=UPI000DBEFCDF|nr:hypothetical protein [Polynucleobacter paneuropaeus]AWW46774.1 hypothetical protein DPM18_08105 [Polynucleobacter paneuropaeus]
MNDLEFLGKINSQRLKSWDEEFREEREQFFKDEKDRKLRRSSKLIKEVTELRYEREVNEQIN